MQAVPLEDAQLSLRRILLIHRLCDVLAALFYA